MDRDAFVRQHYAEGVAEYLLGGDGFSPDRSGPLGVAWDGIFAELVGAGYMRRSQTGRYWWSGTDRGGRPAVGPMVSHRMPQDLIDRLDAHAAATGTTRSDLLRRGAELLLTQEAALVEQHAR
jgi:hypothetical protein